MAARGMKPSDFGLRVRSHPAGLVITAANKMRNGTPMTVSYSADISETSRSTEILKSTGRTTKRFSRFIASLGSKEPLPSGNRIWHEVSGDDVADLLVDVKVHPGSRKARGDYLARYIRRQKSVGGLATWCVALISNRHG